jgi:response regulator RpfG family c-di-GMP phosphodiesterase
LRYRLLIVDDDLLNLKALSRVFEEQYDVVESSDPLEALTILRSDGPHFDLILTDKSMPEMTGLDLLEQAKHLSPAIRILLTGFPAANDLEEVINRGEVFRYIKKPWTVETLRQTVADALEHHQLTRDHNELIAELTRKNAELKAMATRVADNFLRKFGSKGLDSPEEAQLVRRGILASAAFSTVQAAARAILSQLSRARDQLRDSSLPAPVELDCIARDCIAEARRILIVVDEIESLSR